MSWVVRRTPSEGNVVGQRAVARTLCRGILHGVADVQREPELQHREGEHREHRADHRELRDRRASVIAKPSDEQSAQTASRLRAR